jgi:threonine/homoserine/homoserine lactone efflux protein
LYAVPSLDALLAFAAVAFVVIVIPGPSVLFVIGRALAHGRRVAILSVLGNAAGVFVQSVAVAIGLGAIVARSITVLTILRFGGALYLVYLGVEAIRSRRALGAAAAAASPPSADRLRVRQGFVVGVSNPKGFVLFSAVLPQFVDTGLGNVSIQMIIFGGVAVAIAIVSDSVWALVADSARRWFARTPHRSEAVGAGGGVLMIGLGVHLALSGRH